MCFAILVYFDIGYMCVEERERPEANVIHVLTNKVQKFLFAKVASYNLFSYFTLWIFDNVDLITSSRCV